jgi:hypothetical protein
MDERLKKYFDIVRKINQDPASVSESDLEFFLSESPKIEDSKMKEFTASGKDATYEQFRDAVVEATRKLQTEPLYKEKLLKVATESKGKKLSDDLAQGINLVLAGTDIAQSVKQINASNQAAAKSKRPARPAIPQRDLYLQQALRSAEEGTFDSARALAPAQAQIQDQYLSDIQDAKTASTGQAGAYGVYRQLAADRRNRAALNLAPIQDNIQAREQARYDRLLGMRQSETQQMFENQASLYPSDLNQYNTEQNTITSLGATGRANLRDSLYNIGNQFASTAGNFYSKQKYNRLRNQASLSGLNPDNVVKVNQSLDGYVQQPDAYFPSYFNQVY